MKRNTIKTTVSFLMILIIISCKETITAEQKLINIEKVQNDKLEADLFIEATQHNLNTIALCDAIAETEKNQEVKDIAINIKVSQQKILNKLQNLAEENMISVASKPTYQLNVLKYLKNEEVVTTDILETIKNKLETQIEVLDTLRRNTDDDQIEFATQGYIEIIKVNKELTQHTLESLE